MFWDNLWISCKKRSQILLSPGADRGRQIKVVGLLGQRFLEKIQNGGRRFSWFWVSRVKKVIEQFYWLITFLGFNWGQRYLATLVTPQNCTKMLRNLIFKRLSLIVRVNVVLNRTVVVDSDWRFDNLCGSHLQSQSELYHGSWWYYTLVIDLIGQLCRDVIGRLSVKPWCYWLSANYERTTENWQFD